MIDTLPVFMLDQIAFKKGHVTGEDHFVMIK